MNPQGGSGPKRRLSTCEINQESWACYGMLSVTCTTLSVPLAHPYSNMPLWAWTSQAARGPCAEDNCNFSTCKSLFDKIIYKTKQRDYRVCECTLWHTNTTRVLRRFPLVYCIQGSVDFESSPMWYTADTATCRRNSVILCCVVETLEQVLLCNMTRASVSSRSIFLFF